MVDHFFGHRFDLAQLADTFRAKHGTHYEIVTTLDPVHVDTPDFDSAFIVAECMLNLLPITKAHRPDAKLKPTSIGISNCPAVTTAFPCTRTFSRSG